MKIFKFFRITPFVSVLAFGNNEANYIIHLVAQAIKVVKLKNYYRYILLISGEVS